MKTHPVRQNSLDIFWLPEEGCWERFSNKDKERLMLCFGGKTIEIAG